MIEKTHFFSFYAGEEPPFQAVTRVRDKIYSLGGRNIWFHINEETKECKFRFTAKLFESDDIFLYIATLDRCRVYM